MFYIAMFDPTVMYVIAMCLLFLTFLLSPANFRPNILTNPASEIEKKNVWQNRRIKNGW